MNYEEINKAKEVLREAGYHVSSLWHVEDITDRYECDKDTAYEILSEVLDANIDTIFESIHHQATIENNLNEKNND